MKLIGWQNWYSIPVYIAVFGVWLPWHLEAMKKVFTGSVKQRYSGYIDAQPALKPLDIAGDGAEEDN
jgi:hypothetical protein